ncbi:hypothetical protein [Bartonella sp. CE47NXGY]|uniref:hypothetical protein n=1 Tax=Bartonella sp. CE47NXGY TaxID=3243514 RepID=UPI0035D0730C
MSDHDTFIVIVGIVIIGSIIYSLWLANYQKKQLSEQLEQYEKLLQLKDRECAIYHDIIAQWEQRLVKKLKKYRQNGLNNGMKKQSIGKEIYWR